MGEKSETAGSKTSVMPRAFRLSARSRSDAVSNFGRARLTIRYLLSTLSPPLRRKSIVVSSASSASGATPSSGSRSHMAPLPSNRLENAEKWSLQ